MKPVSVETRLAYVMEHFHLVHDLPMLTYSYQDSDASDVVFFLSDEASMFEREDGFQPQEVGWMEWQGQQIPVLFGQGPGKELFQILDGRLHFNLDLVSHVFFFLSGWQERDSEQRDDVGRYPFSSSIQHKLGILHLPVVEYYLDMIRAGLEAFTGKAISRRFYHEGGAAVFLSHDIDSCQSAWMQGGKHLLKSGKPFSAAKLLVQKLMGKDDWFNFDEIIRLEQQFQARSSFYFLAQQTRVHGRANADYDVTSRDIRSAMDSIRLAGSEVGVHGSLGSSTNLSLLREDIAKVDQDCVGGRFHFLAYDPLASVTLLIESGLKYDSSLGFAEQIGFRNCSCHPFFLFDHASGKPSPVLEIPLMVMDATLQFKKYMGLTHDEAVIQVGLLAEEVQKWGGFFSILWHNTHFSEHKYEGWKRVLETILQQFQKQHARYFTGQEIHEMVRRHVL